MTKKTKKTDPQQLPEVHSTAGKPTTKADLSERGKELAALLERVKRGSAASPFDTIPSPQKRAWLTAYALTGVKARASAAAGLDQTTIYTDQWRLDADFTEAMDRARVMSADVLEAEAYRRAVEGVEEPVGWYKGEAGGVVRRYSDVLLIFTLKGLLPDRYRERVDVRGVLAHLDVSQLPDALVARLAAGENPITVLAPILQASPDPPGAGPGRGRKPARRAGKGGIEGSDTGNSSKDAKKNCV